MKLKKTNSLSSKNVRHKYHLSDFLKYGAKTNTAVHILKTIELSVDDELIYCSGYDCEHIVVLKINKPEFFEYLIKHTDCVFCIITHSGKNLVVSGGRDKKICFWRILKGENGNITGHSFINEFTKIQQFVQSLRISQNGEKVFALYDSNLIYEICVNESIVIRRYDHFVSSFHDKYFDVSSNGKRLFGAKERNSHIIKSIITKGESLRTLFYQTKGSVNSVKTISQIHLAIFGNNSNEVLFMDTRQYKFRKKFYLTNGNSTNMFLVGSSDDGRLVSAASFTGNVFVFRINERLKISLWKKIQNVLPKIESTIISKNKKFLIFGGGNNLVVLNAELPQSKIVI